MSVPMVKKCCCRASLHTGTLIIAYIYTVWSLLELLGYSLLVTLAPIGRNATISSHKYALYITAAVVSGVTLLCSILLVVAAHKGTSLFSSHKYAIYITAAVVSGVTLLCSILLVVAAHKKLAFLTLPWTIVTGILTAVFFTMCLTGISLILQDEGKTLEVEAVVIVVHLTRACISVYCIVVVHSRHKQIMYENDERRFQRSGRVYAPVRTKDQAL